MKTLQIIESAYRATLEEQDDPVVWITHAMRGAGAPFSVLLKGNAVSYAVAGQDAGGLRVGTWRQTQPPRLPGDIAGLIGKDVEVYAVDEDLTDRGIDRDALIDGIKVLPRGRIASFVARQAGSRREPVRADASGGVSRHPDRRTPVEAPGDEPACVLGAACLDVRGEQRVLDEVALRAAAADAHGLGQGMLEEMDGTIPVPARVGPEALGYGRHDVPCGQLAGREPIA
jgi:intracellular sulfur oxidation DsrE/DsrF family protein